VAHAHELALAKNWKDAIFLNGLAYSTALGLPVSTKVALSAMEAGALTAGLSGTGPATIIIVEQECVDNILSAIEDIDESAYIIRTELNYNKAGVD
jgi:shikimate kinase